MIHSVLRILMFSMIVINQTKSQMVLFDNFKKNNHSWVLITDKVMGGMSSGYLDFLQENQYVFMRLRGDVTIENNGGFIQARKILNKNSPVINEGIIFETRGNLNEYFIHIRTKYTILPWQYYQAKFKSKKKWQDINIKLTDFKRSGKILPKNINPNTVKSLAIVAYGKDYKAMLDIKNINFY